MEQILGMLLGKTLLTGMGEPPIRVTHTCKLREKSNEAPGLQPDPLSYWLGGTLPDLLNLGSHANMQEDKCTVTYMIQELTPMSTDLDILGLYTQAAICTGLL